MLEETGVEARLGFEFYVNILLLLLLIIIIIINNNTVPLLALLHEPPGRGTITMFAKIMDDIIIFTLIWRQTSSQGK